MKHTVLLAAAFVWGLTTVGTKAQIFEVIHPDVEEGGFEVELLNTAVVDDVASGEERSIHEVAIAYAPFSFWKTAIAFEVATVADLYNGFDELMIMSRGRQAFAGHVDEAL